MILIFPAFAQEAPAPDEVPPLRKEPTLATFVEAPYPPEAEAAGLQATVRLLLEIDEQGTVTRVEVLEPVGHGFDEAAVEAARQFRFTPAEDADGPVPVAIEFAYGFALKAPPPAEAIEPPVVVEGVIKEMATRTLLAGAGVQVLRDGVVVATTTTDAEGRFALRGLPPGEVTLVARGIDHQDAEVEVEVVEGSVAQVTLWQRARSYRDPGIVGTYAVERPAEVTRRTLSIEEVRRVPGTFGDPVRVIQSLPGAARSPFSTGLLVLRGANPEDSNVYVDGVEVPLVYHLGGFRSILNPDLITAVDYMPGGQGVRYGRATGGAIDVRTQEEYPERVHVTAKADVLDAGAYAEGRVGEIGFALGARRSYLDGILGIVLRDQEFYAAPRWMDYQLKLAWLGDGPDELSLLLFGFDDQLIVRTSADEGDQLGLSYSTHRLVLTWSRPLSETLTLRLQPALGLDGTTFGFGQQVELELSAALLDLRGEVAWTPSPALTVAAGVDAEASRNDLAVYVGSVPVDGDNPLSEEEPLAVEAGLWQGMPDPFAEATWRPLADPEQLALVAGVRIPLLIRSEEPVAAAVDPRLAGRWRVFPIGTLKGGTGLYHQPPQLATLAGDLAYERAWSSEIGWEQQVGPIVQADVTGFYRWMDPLTAGFGDDTGVGRAYGMEAMVRWPLRDRFFGWVSYTLSKSERNDTPDDPEGWYAFDFDQTHILTGVAGYRLPFDFELGGKVQYVTGNPYTPYDGGLYLMDEGGYVGFPSAATNSERMPPFWAVDVRVDKLFTFEQWQFELFVDVLNVVHGENPEFMLYNYDYTEHDYISGLPLIPSLGFQVEVNL